MAAADDPRAQARQRWLDADERAAKIDAQVYIPVGGSTGGQRKDLETARRKADQLRFEYLDLERREHERQILELQRSQTRATWASFTVAAVVGAATVVSVLVALFG